VTRTAADDKRLKLMRRTSIPDPHAWTPLRETQPAEIVTNSSWEDRGEPILETTKFLNKPQILKPTKFLNFLNLLNSVAARDEWQLQPI
jgi:hypothetical protein